MSHPSREQLVGFVYEELPPVEHAEVSRHMGGCDECRERVASWGEVRDALATWKLDERRRPAPQERFVLPSVARWAAAAIVFIATGFVIARLTAPAVPDVDQLRAELQSDVSVQLAKHADEQLAAQRAFLRDVDGRFNQIERERLAAYSGLRKDVDTVAMHTEEAFVRLVNMTAPTDN